MSAASDYNNRNHHALIRGWLVKQPLFIKNRSRVSKAAPFIPSRKHQGLLNKEAWDNCALFYDIYSDRITPIL